MSLEKEYLNKSQAMKYLKKDFYFVKKIFDLAKQKKETFYSIKSQTPIGIITSDALPKSVIDRLFKEIY